MEELVKRLRRMLDWELCDYDHNFKFADETIAEAADAIEELVRKEKFHAFLWNTIQPNEMEAYLSMYNAGSEKEEN